MGWTHEGISLPIAMALVARTLLFRRSPRRLPFCMDLTFLLGAASSAGSALHPSHAAEASDADGLLYNSFLILWSVFTQLRFFFAAVVLLILALLRRKTGLVTFLAENFVWDGRTRAFPCPLPWRWWRGLCCSEDRRGDFLSAWT